MPNFSCSSRRRPPTPRSPFCWGSFPNRKQDSRFSPANSRFQTAREFQRNPLCSKCLLANREARIVNFEGLSRFFPVRTGNSGLGDWFAGDYLHHHAFLGNRLFRRSAENSRVFRILGAGTPADQPIGGWRPCLNNASFASVAQMRVMTRSSWTRAITSSRAAASFTLTCGWYVSIR
jgi:hypothetical protein